MITQLHSTAYMLNLHIGVLLIFTIFMPYIPLAQQTGKQAELIRLRDRAEEAISIGDPHEAALAIGKAALMVSLWAKKEERNELQAYFQSLETILRAQESAYRAIALFQQSGEQIPASSGVCHSIFLALNHQKKAKKLLVTPIPQDPLFQNLPIDLQEWKETIDELRTDFGCTNQHS